MQHNIVLLTSITMALVAAFAGGLLARRLGLPAIVGYLVGGVVVGPFTPGFVGDSSALSQLAEIGVVFMMFGVGLHFSLRDLWNVRHIAIPGALLQMLIGTAFGFLLAEAWGWSPAAGFILGVSVSIASTVVLIRNLTDNGLLNTPGGKVATGWLILEDLATIVVLVMLPVLFAGNGASGSVLAANIGLALLKTAAFVAIMLFLGTRVLPWLLVRIARFRSRELFLLAVVALALGTAFGAAELFGVSLALGAFLAGVVIGESGPAHQVAADALPFQDLFSIIFFVSVGMLVNPLTLVQHAWKVLLLTLVIVIGKWLINMGLGFFLPSTALTSITVAAALSQIGEFSFIVGQAGVSLGVLSTEQYGLILAASAISIAINPLIFKTIPYVEKGLRRVPAIWNRLERKARVIEAKPAAFDNHVIIIGYGRTGSYTARVLDEIGVPYLVIELDVFLAEKASDAGIPILFGDASNSEVLKHAGLDRACALVVTGSDESATELIVAHVHDLFPSLPIVARACTEDGVRRLVELGAHHVVHPELEGGLEIMRHTLLDLGHSPNQIQQYTDAVRHNAYSAISRSAGRPHALDQLITAIRGVEVQWSAVGDKSAVAGKTIAAANLRATCGASIVALVRDGVVMANPKSSTVIIPGDLIGMIGSPQELAEAGNILAP
ncbi:MAG: cation:proton antiporter [Coriobacteriia bacterium]